MYVTAARVYHVRITIIFSDIIFIVSPIYISSVYSPFSDRVGLPPHTIPYSEVLMKSIGADFLLPDAHPGVNHTCV